MDGNQYPYRLIDLVSSNVRSNVHSEFTFLNFTNKVLQAVAKIEYQVSLCRCPFGSCQSDLFATIWGKSALSKCCRCYVIVCGDDELTSASVVHHTASVTPHNICRPFDQLLCDGPLLIQRCALLPLAMHACFVASDVLSFRSLCSFYPFIFFVCPPICSFPFPVWLFPLTFWWWWYVC